jgi:multidrug efflux system membrane fusion protein
MHRTHRIRFLTARLPVAVLFACVSLLAACSDSGDKQETGQSPHELLQAQALHPVPVNESDRWHLVADVVPEKLSPLAFQVPGRVLERRVDPGDRVSHDQVLMVLDDTDLQLKLKALQAQLAAAESDLVLARKEWQRIKTLFAKKLVSQDLVDNAQNRLNNVKARVEALRWQVRQLQQQLEYAQLRAPADGVIIDVQSEVGAVVAPGHPVLTMQIGPALEFAVGIPAARLHQLPDRATAVVGTDRIPVQLRYLSPQADPVTRTWPARFQIAQPEAVKQPLVPGDFAEMWFQQPVKAPLLKVPLSAVFAESGKHYVWRIDTSTQPATVHRLAVTVVKTFPTAVWIRGPLGTDDLIVAMGAHLLSEGQPVRVKLP